MGELRVSSLSHEQIERICEIAEEAAREEILSKVPTRGISDLSIAVDSGGGEALSIEVEVNIVLSPVFRSLNARDLADKSVEVAFEAVEKHLREAGCQFRE